MVGVVVIARQRVNKKGRELKTARSDLTTAKRDLEVADGKIEEEKQKLLAERESEVCVDCIPPEEERMGMDEIDGAQVSVCVCVCVCARDVN